MKYTNKTVLSVLAMAAIGLGAAAIAPAQDMSDSNFPRVDRQVQTINQQILVLQAEKHKLVTNLPRLRRQSDHRQYRSTQNQIVSLQRRITDLIRQRDNLRRMEMAHHQTWKSGYSNRFTGDKATRIREISAEIGRLTAQKAILARDIQEERQEKNNHEYQFNSQKLRSLDIQINNLYRERAQLQHQH